ncbi:endonuclease/exonuclease/phosphatase family protein [Vibrio sp. LaRot3]|uniref:endonuclease/exonuclease/phosphatase family protein n=1 Tax=Vibrio sp. LaRot3 TaxID=2998829 RepID=UPI0022CDCB85|nr:endonuclease/exonuclease/phosphatase family protein [Vibrio sp. LaRot3]MDA0146856.1 endonuclease/exonuclease/phosphatase family protein [Vibrio sp. LaRot3]
MNRKRLALLLPLAVVSVAVIGYHTIFKLPQSPQLTTVSGQSSQLEVSTNQGQPELTCFESQTAEPIDLNGQINLLVWNIYKQNRSNWQQISQEITQDKQLLLFQEASMTDALKAWINQDNWSGNLVDAFKAFDTSAGVLNLAHQLPIKACAYTELEPWLRLPKSALYAEYALSNGQSLAVVNIHAVNFTYGTEEYHRQLSTLANALKQHQGPMIVAGDFNSWSEQRMLVMREVLESVGVIEASLQPDNRTQFVTGLPLDHLFYRGLALETAKASITDASDHNPIEARFSIEQ